MCDIPSLSKHQIPRQHLSTQYLTAFRDKPYSTPNPISHDMETCEDPLRFLRLLSETITASLPGSCEFPQKEID